MNIIRKALIAVCFIGLAGALTACGDEAEGPIESRTIEVDGQAVEGAIYSAEASPLLASRALEPMAEDGPMSLCEAWCAEACGGRSNVKWCHSGGGGCSTSCKGASVVGLDRPAEVLTP